MAENEEKVPGADEPALNLAGKPKDTLSGEKQEEKEEKDEKKNDPSNSEKPAELKKPEMPKKPDADKDWVEFIQAMFDFIKAQNQYLKDHQHYLNEKARTEATKNAQNRKPDPKGLKTDPIDTEREKKEDTTFIKTEAAADKEAQTNAVKEAAKQADANARKPAVLAPMSDTEKAGRPEKIEMDKKEKVKAEVVEEVKPGNTPAL